MFVALQFIWVGNKLFEILSQYVGFSMFQEFDKIDSSSFIVYSCFPSLLASLEKKECLKPVPVRFLSQRVQS